MDSCLRRNEIELSRRPRCHAPIRRDLLTSHAHVPSERWRHIAVEFRLQCQNLTLEDWKNWR